MLDRFDDLKKVSTRSPHSFKLVQQENAQSMLNTVDIDEEKEQQNNDRELILEFLEHTKEVQKGINEMETNNADMRNLVNELITDKKQAQNQQSLQDDINTLMSENTLNQGMIKEKLDLMT